MGPSRRHDERFKCCRATGVSSGGREPRVDAHCPAFGLFWHSHRCLKWEAVCVVSSDFTYLLALCSESLLLMSVVVLTAWFAFAPNYILGTKRRAGGASLVVNNF